jgi:hypothetical protein
MARLGWRLAINFVKTEFKFTSSISLVLCDLEKTSELGLNKV